MRETLRLPPPADFTSLGPSGLFKFFFQIGRWTEESFSSDFQTYTRGKLISTATISKWKNQDAIPTRYAGQLFKLVEDLFEPEIAKEWIAAFETVWAIHIARPAQNNTKLDDENASFSNMVYRQHCSWITQQYGEPLFGETFAASDIYVPLQLIDLGADESTVIDTKDLLVGLDNNTQKGWTFISGGPGSGKSMAALHLAQSLCETDVFPIYLRGSHFSDIEIDIQSSDQLIIDSFSLRSFLKHFRASALDQACLIIDGIDEISEGPSGTTNRLEQLFRELNLERNVCHAHGKSLHIIILGRQSYIDLATTHVSPTDFNRLDMLALDGSCDAVSEVPKNLLGKDLREEWWIRYLSAKNYPYDSSLPDFLCTDYDDFFGFSSDPLLTHLICTIAFNGFEVSSTKIMPHEVVNALTYANSKNQVYKLLIDYIHQREPLPRVRKEDFLSVLQHMALAHWHAGDSQVVTIGAVQDSLKNTSAKAAFETLYPTSYLGRQYSPHNLFTGIYNRVINNDQGSENQIVLEFTHSPFSDYFLSTLIFDRFKKLIIAFETKLNIETALESWASLSKAGAHTPSLGDFCEREARQRYDDFSTLNWETALSILRNHLDVSHYDSKGTDSLSQLQSSASLLLFIWSTLNLERHRRTGETINVFDSSASLSPLDFKRIQRPSTLNIQKGTLTEPQLKYGTFLTNCLSAQSFKLADMSQLSFSTGHMQALICEETSFAMTHWSHVKITASVFNRCPFQQSIFYGCRWMGTTLSNCFFQGAKIQWSSFSNCSLKGTSFSQCHFSDVEFSSTDLAGAIFDRCTFTNCFFTEEESNTNGASFRHCSFSNMKKHFLQTQKHIFEDCMFQGEGIVPHHSNKIVGLENSLGRFT